MKEATGELSMVVITIVAVVAILVLWNFMSPRLTNWVGRKFGEIEDSNDDSARKACVTAGGTWSQDASGKWGCN